jgi:hypothetical protein
VSFKRRVNDMAYDFILSKLSVLAEF